MGFYYLFIHFRGHQYYTTNTINQAKQNREYSFYSSMYLSTHYLLN